MMPSTVLPVFLSVVAATAIFFSAAFAAAANGNAIKFASFVI